MKKILILLSIFLIGCQNKKSEKEVKVLTNDLKIKEIDYEKSIIQYLDRIPQNSLFYFTEESPSYPFTSYIDQEKGNFTTFFIGKSNVIESFWSRNYGDFFEKIKGITDEEIISKKIKSELDKNKSNYYKIISFLPKESISQDSEENDEYQIKENAYGYFYLNEDGKWKFLKKVKANEIEKTGTLFYKKMIISHRLKDIERISNSFLGKYRVSVEGDYTNHGREMYNYEINISENEISLHETGSELCSGRYRGKENRNALELFYAQDDDERCVDINASYTIKKEGGQFYIQGVGGEGTYNEWTPLKKVTKFEN